jgi:hypothetical protein
MESLSGEVEARTALAKIEKRDGNFPSMNYRRFNASTKSLAAGGTPA